MFIHRKKLLGKQMFSTSTSTPSDTDHDSDLELDHTPPSKKHASDQQVIRDQQKAIEELKLQLESLQKGIQYDCIYLN